MTDTGIVKTIRCEGCGRTLKPAALFCTACGTRRDVVPEPVETPAPEPVAADTANCTSCGVALRPGAEFCTECGAKSAQGPINLTVEGASAATEAPPAPADRVSPAASRAILAPVSGGMGSYVGKSAPASDAPPPPVLPGSGDAGDDHHRRNVAIVAVVAAVLLLIGGIAVLVATQHSGDGSLTAGQGSRQSVDGSFTTGHRSDSSSDSSSDSTSGSSGSTGTSGSTKSTSGSTTGSTKVSGSDTTTGSKSGSTGGSTTGGKPSSPSKSSTTGSKTTSPPRHTPPPPKTPTVPPAKLDVSTSSISVTRDAGSVTIRNTGGKSMYWNISSVGMSNGSLSFSSSGGTLGAGASTTVSVSWSSTDEGTGSGSFRINGAGSARTVSVNGDSSEQDTVNNVRQAGCGVSCSDGSMVYIQIDLKAFNGARPTLPQQVCFQVQATNQATQCYRYTDWGGVLKPGNLAQVKVPVKWNNFTSGSTQLKVWAVDLDGRQSAVQLKTILQ